MQQHAIVFHKNNADIVAAGLTGYTAEDLLEEHEYYLNLHTNLVLCKDVLDSGFATPSYVVTVSVFESNTGPVTDLNDKTYTFIRTV